MNLQRIEDKAASLLKGLGLFHEPICLEAVIEGLELEIKAENLGDEISGLLVIEKDRAMIGYNSTESEVRQRFTIAHELGHYFLHHSLENGREKVFIDKIMYRKNYSSSYEKKQEMQANSFAAALLMPSELIIKAFRTAMEKELTEEGIIENLSNNFKVSTIAMTYRLMNLNLLHS